VRTVLGRRFVAIIALFVIILGTCALIAISVIRGWSWSSYAIGFAASVVGIAVAAVAPVRRLLAGARGTLPLSDTTLSQAREDLARALAAAWAEEDRLRRINDPWPLQVRWPGPHAGQFDEIGRVFAGLPSGRLVILGEAGAGKTALAVKLVRELLRQRRPGDPVPVLLPAATWMEPCSLTDWVAFQLALDHPGLAVRLKTGTGDTVPLARSLAESEVLPVIDGLDELPRERRAQVIAEINAYGSDNPLVVTSRPDEYQAATATRPVALATLITLAPLGPADVRDYLMDATEAPAERWDPVFDELDADPGGPLARVLTNPLMLWLARTEYESATTLPGELADRNRFAERDLIEGHLLAGFIPAAYAQRRRPRGFRCSPAQAQRWLGFLASWQSRTEAPDIAWWRLCLAERGWSALLFAVRGVLYICIGWWAASWVLIRSGYWTAGAHTWHGHFRDLLLAGPLGRAVRPLTDQITRPLSLSGFDSSLDLALRDVVSFGLPRVALVVAVIGAIAGAGGTERALAPQTPRVTAANIRSVARRLALIALLAFLVWISRTHREPIPLIASLWRTKLALIWLGILAVEWFLSGLAVPVDVSSATEPAALLRRARSVYLLRCVVALISIAAIWLWCGTTIAVADAGLTVAGFVIVVVAGSSTRSAWPRYLETRLRLSVRQRLPWRVLPFLEDAHRRGVLRQVGATYQFRHIRLQQQLAADYSPVPPWLVSLVNRGREIPRRLAGPAGLPEFETVDSHTVSGAIPRRTRRAAIRYQIATDALPASLAGLIVLAFGFLSWFFWAAGFPLIGGAMLLSARARSRRYQAGVGIVPGTWSLRVTADRVDVSRDGATLSLEMSDIDHVSVTTVRAPDGSITEWTGLCLLLRRGLAVTFPVSGRSLPAAWLPTTGTFVKRTRIPDTILRWFPDELLSTGMAGVNRASATEYSASGTIAEPDIPWVDGLLSPLAATAALILFHQLGLVFWVCSPCLVVMLGVSLYRLDLRVALRSLPKGPWSLLVTRDRIEVTVNGVVTRLSRDDVKESDIRPLRGGRGRDTLFFTVHVRLRPGLAAPYLARDGWFPVYLNPVFVSSELPTDLMAALHGFGGDRFGARLAKLAARRGVPRS
jgi:hypothetical protein